MAMQRKLFWELKGALYSTLASQKGPKPLSDSEVAW